MAVKRVTELSGANRWGASGLGGDPLSCGTRGFEVRARRVCGRGISPMAGRNNYVSGLTWTIDFYSRRDWLNPCDRPITGTIDFYSSSDWFPSTVLLSRPFC